MHVTGVRPVSITQPVYATHTIYVFVHWNSARCALRASREPACGRAGGVWRNLASSLVDLPMCALASAITINRGLALSASWTGTIITTVGAGVPLGEALKRSGRNRSGRADRCVPQRPNPQKHFENHIDQHTTCGQEKNPIPRLDLERSTINRYTAVKSEWDAHFWWDGQSDDFIPPCLLICPASRGQD